MNQQSVGGDLFTRKGLINYLLIRWLKKSTIVEIIALLYVILFLYAGISKLMEFTAFSVQLTESELLRPVANILVWAVPATEFIIAVLLFLPATRLKGLYSGLTLMTLFTLYIIVILTAFEEIPCSCGGVLQQLSWGHHLLFNCGYLVLGLIGVKLGRQVNTVNRSTT